MESPMNPEWLELQKIHTSYIILIDLKLFNCDGVVLSFIGISLVFPYLNLNLPPITLQNETI